MKHKYVAMGLAVMMAFPAVGCGFGGSTNTTPYPDGWVKEAREAAPSTEEDNPDAAIEVEVDVSSGNQSGSAGGEQSDSTGGDQSDSSSGDQSGSAEGDQSDSSGGDQSDSTGGVQSGSSGGNQSGSSSGNQSCTSAGTAETKVVSDEPEKSQTVNYLFDTSGSMNQYTGIVLICAAAEKAGAGKEQNYYSVDKDGNLFETDEKLALSGKYDCGAVIDVVGDQEIPVEVNGVNVMTTDLLSGTSARDLGKWLVSTGAEGYTFYVFRMDFEGLIGFTTYTSNTDKEYVTVNDCKFEREFLMVVFGNNDLVKEYDEAFQKKLGDKLEYDSMHVSRTEEDTDELQKGILSLSSGKCFTRNEANITYGNTNYCFGLESVDTSGIDFTLANTFVYKKSSKSVGTDEKAVRAVLYTAPKVEVPRITDQKVTVLEYDEAQNTYLESDEEFEVTAEGFLDGLPAADDEKTNETLGGNLVPAGTAAFRVTVENQNLSEGIYGLDVKLICESDSEEDFQEFAENHSMGLEDYTAALDTECEKQEGSTSKYSHTGKKSVYRSLLEFEAVADEITAAGIKPETKKEVIAFRVLIDNRAK